MTTDTRQTIITAAFDLFGRHGYHGTSMRRIATAADLALGGLYNHFTNKEELFQAVILAHHPLIHALPRLKTAQGESTADLLRHAARLIMEDLDRNPTLLNLMLIEMTEHNGRHLPLLAEHILPPMQTFIQRIMASSPGVRTDNPAVLLRSFVGLMLGYVISGRVMGTVAGPAVATVTLDEYVEVYLHGLVVPL